MTTISRHLADGGFRHARRRDRRLPFVLETTVFDVGETPTRDDRYWASWADWLDMPRHTVAALVGAVTAQGRDNSDALRLLRHGTNAHEGLYPVTHEHQTDGMVLVRSVLRLADHRR